MEYTTLGKSGLKVSRLTLGCMSLGDGSRMKWSLDEAGAEPIVKQALDLGITFWDTANIYGYGSSETIVGNLLHKFAKRDDIVLATKLFMPMHDGPGGSGLSRKAVFEQVDASLARLQTDYIDLYQIHRFDSNTPIEETMEALHDVIKAGKVRYVGASSMWAWQFAKMQYVAESNGWTKFISMQDQYNLVMREEEREMFPLLVDIGVGSMPWSPLAAGLVTRPWGQKSSTKRSETNPEVDMYGNPLFQPSDESTVGAVQRIAEERNVSMAQIGMAWVLKNPVVDAPIIGATKPHHLADAVAALDIELSEKDIALEEHYTSRVPTYFR